MGQTQPGGQRLGVGPRKVWRAWGPGPLAFPGMSATVRGQALLEPLLAYLQSSPLALLGLMGILLLCGLGLPLPEDVVLISAGLLAAGKGHSWIYASGAMYVGVIAGDALAFWIGHRFGLRLLAIPWVGARVPPAKVQTIQRLFARYGSWVFFIARFLPGLRAAIFCLAGVMRASFGRFLAFDGLAGLISVPLWVWLGHFLGVKFGDDLEELRTAIARSRHYSLAVAGAAVLALAGLWWWRRRARARGEANA